MSVCSTSKGTEERLLKSHPQLFTYEDCFWVCGPGLYLENLVFYAFILLPADYFGNSTSGYCVLSFMSSSFIAKMFLNMLHCFMLLKYP